MSEQAYRLPVDAIRDEFEQVLASEPVLLIQSPTGSGKSTQIPQWLLDTLDGQIVVLEPRRVAARLLARRVAEERNGSLGAEVGYQVRFDHRVGGATRLRFVTDGLLLRQLVADPSLDKVSAVVFDEFHERHLESDVVLSLLRRLQEQSRPDLKLIIMSATLDAATLVERLGTCKILQAEGRIHPVEIRYLDKPLHPKKTPVWDAAGVACAQLVKEQVDGNILVFMPGRFEIRKTLEALRKDKLHQILSLHELHGGMTLEDQARVLAPGSGRKCIVTTNLAESSLTVEGVSGVVDSGLVRISHYDPHRKMNTLLIEPISRASADQRSGRAGRTREGICYRLWTESGHSNRDAFTLPEVMRSDLASAILNAISITHGSVYDLPWFEPPQEARKEESIRLLKQLGALDEGGSLTHDGKAMANLPLHPRDAKLLLAAETFSLQAEAALLVCLLQAGTILTPTKSWEFKRQREQKLPEIDSSDLLRELAAYVYILDSGWNESECRTLNLNLRTGRLVQKAYDQLCKQIRISPKKEIRLSDESIGNLRKLLFLSRTDQLAHRVGDSRRYLLAGGGEVALDENSVVRKAPWIVAVDLIELGRLDHSSSLKISSASKVDPQWIEDDLGEWIETSSECFLDKQTRRVMRRNSRTIQGLILEEKRRDETDVNAAAEALALGWREGAFTIHQWGEDVDRWVRRYNLLVQLYPETGLHAFGEEDKAAVIEQFVYGSFRVKELKEKKLMPLVRDSLAPEFQSMLADMIPEKITLPSGKQKQITYPQDGEPSLEAFIQELFGMTKTPMIADGRVSLKLHLLAPNRRSVQVTTDLPRFWTEHYPGIQNQLKKRYPKHAWPEDPMKKE